MALNDSLAVALEKINQYEQKTKSEVVLNPVSKLLKNTLNLLKNLNYVGDFVVEKHNNVEFLKLNLLGQINKIGVIKPRFFVKANEYDKFEKRFLPAQDFGVLIVSTNKGLMTHYEAKKQKIGGVLIAYCY